MPRWLALALLPGCAFSARAGPDARIHDGAPTMGAQGTVMGGLGSPNPYAAFGVPVTLSVGGRTDRPETRAELESGLEYATDVYEAFGFRVGPRFGATVAGPSGAYAGLRGGPTLALPTGKLTLDMYTSYGLGGAIAGDAIFGTSLAFGFDYAQGLGRIPSGRPFRGANGDGLHAGLVRASRSGARVARRFAIGAQNRRRQGERWLADARNEHSAIAAFVQLAGDLARHGAPAALVHRAHQAALEEAGHAADCLRIANDYLDDDLAFAPWSEPPVASSLAEMAVSSLVDGAFGEGLAAREARERLERLEGLAPDPYEAAVLERIAREEASHADLAWDVLSFCLWRDPTLRSPLFDHWRSLQTRTRTQTRTPLDPPMSARVDAGLRVTFALLDGLERDTLARWEGGTRSGSRRTRGTCASRVFGARPLRG